MIPVTVLSNEVITRSLTTKAGKPLTIREQKIRVELNDEVRLTTISLDENTAPYSPGHYEFDPASIIQIGRFGGFETIPFARVHLKPVISTLEQTSEQAKVETDQEKVSATLFGRKQANA